jgi:hypothetical protein
MNTLRAIFHMMRADFLERTRRASFLITLAMGIFVVSVFLPAADVNYSTLAFHGPPVVDARGNVSFLEHVWYRGVYNSAWIGIVVALLTSLWLGLIGFYLVKNTVERDLRTGVGQILATTPLNRVQYTLGKALSNFAFLTCMVAVTVMAAGALQVLRGEDLHIDLWMLASPFLFMTLPVMALVSAIAVLFETIAWLRAGWGNIVYFILWAVGFRVLLQTADTAGPAADLLGFASVFRQWNVAIKAVAPAANVHVSIGFSPPLHAPLQTFSWQGMSWTGDLLAGRLQWVALAFLIAALAAIFFSRFDPARDRGWSRARATAPRHPSVEQETSAVLASVSLTPLPTHLRKLQPIIILMGEVRLLLKSVTWWWYLVAAGLALATLFVPLSVAHDYLFPIAWVWPLLLWSPLGNRERRYDVKQLVFSVAHPLAGQLPMQWLSGVLLALLTASAMMARFALIGDWSGLLALLAGAIFIPSLALAAGTWTGNSRFFETLYLLLWYAGPLTHVAFLDYMGVTGSALTMHMPVVYTLAAVTLLVLAFLGRQRQLQV